MAHIEYKPVFGRIEYIMESHGGFYHAEIGPYVATVCSQFLDQRRAEFIAKLPEFGYGKMLIIGGRVDGIKVGSHLKRFLELLESGYHFNF